MTASECATALEVGISDKIGMLYQAQLETGGFPAGTARPL